MSISAAAAQKKPDTKLDEKAEKLRQEAVVFLRESIAEVNSMRSLENRISFGAEMASLMWYHSDKEARAMYLGVMDDFKRLISEFDGRLNRIETARAAGDENLSAEFMAELSGRSNIERKFRKALEIRQEISMSLAEHEPDLAFAFYYDSLTWITNPGIRERAGESDDYFELRLMTAIAETNANKAAQLALKSLDKGFNVQHLELLKKIYAKDADKGAEFGAAIVSRLKSSQSNGPELWTLSSLILFAEDTTKSASKGSAKKPVLTNSEIRDVAELLATALLASDDPGATGTAYLSILEKYAPARAIQIRQKARSQSRNTNTNSATVYGLSTAANAVANTAAHDVESERRAKVLEERIEAEKKTMDDVQSLGTKPLSKEEREKIVGQARKIISRTPGVENKLTGLSLLAAQVAKAGDLEIAAAIMKDAESLVNPQPKNYRDFLLTWMLISGYAEVDVNKAFPMLSDTIFRLNDTIAAFVKAAEFIDVQGEIIDDGEVQVGQFGGSMLRGITKELKVAEPTLRSLAKADFAKTKAATNLFDRAEVRILAKMIVLRTILGGKEKEKEDPNIGLVLN